MRKLLLGALAGCLLATATPANSVLTVHTYVAYDVDATDGCVFVAIKDDTLPLLPIGGNHSWTGVGVLAAPGTAAARCYIKINGVEERTVPALVSQAGFAVGAVAAGYFFYARLVDYIEFCSDHSVTRCDEATVIEVPSQSADDLQRSAAEQFLDPTLCVVLGTQAPGVPPTLNIDPSGDVAIENGPHRRVWDCPPYND